MERERTFRTELLRYAGEYGWRAAMQQVWRRIANVWSRSIHVVPRSRIAAYREKHLTMQFSPEQVMHFAHSTDPLRCPNCGAGTPVDHVEVHELFKNNIQSLRRGACPRCGHSCEWEHQFFDGYMGVREGDDWILLVFRPSLIERVKMLLGIMPVLDRPQR